MSARSYTPYALCLATLAILMSMSLLHRSCGAMQQVPAVAA